MMATSVVGIGIAGKKVKSSPAISSPHSVSLHETPIVAQSSSDSNISSEEISQYTDNEDDRMSLTPDLSNLSSSSGKQLALSSTQGREASPAPSHSYFHEDETDIALSQLKELDIAIEVRKVTKIDGRKTRWIEYRKQRGTSDRPFKEEDDSFDEIEDKPRRRSKNNRISANEELDINENSSPIKSELIDKLDTSSVNIDDSCSNYSNTSMKVENNAVAVSPLGTNNVLETMKQQFLQGTVHLPETPSNGIKMKKKPIKKVKSFDGAENLGRRRGRPKKGDSPKNSPPKTSTPIIKNESSASIDSSFLETSTGTIMTPKSTGTVMTPNSTNGFSLNAVKKAEPSLTSLSPSDFYSKKNFLTKGLREVRKSESGSESGTSSPEKNGTPTSTCPSTPLPVSPISHPLAGDLETSTAIKCPLITAAARALSAGNKKAQNNLMTKKKKVLKKQSKKESFLFPSAKPIETVTPKTAVKIGASLSSDVESEKESISSSGSGSNEDSSSAKKRGRGRQKNKEENVKKTATVYADVHNTMNGEPQTVIPAIKNTVQRKRKSPVKKPANLIDLKSNNNSNESTVPNNSPLMSASLLDSSNKSPPSASTITINNSLDNSSMNSTNNKTPIQQNIVTPQQNKEFTKVSPQHKESSPIVAKPTGLSNNNNTVWSAQNSNTVKKTLKSPLTTYRPIAMKPPAVKKSPSTIIVSTSEAIKKNTQEKKLIPVSCEPPKKLVSIKKRSSIIIDDSPKNNLQQSNNTPQDVQNQPNVGSINSSTSTNSSKSVINVKATKTTPIKAKSINAIIEKLQSPVPKVATDEPKSLEEDPLLKSELSSSIEDSKKSKSTIAEIAEKSTAKPKEKVPRFLKQLFQDEGVQNMLRSVNEENISAVDGALNSDTGSHKLRPKRANDNLASDSPEPDETQVLPNLKRKKRGTEVDKLFLDEGTLNLLTTLDSNSRRPQGTDDTNSESSQAGSSKNLKINRPNSNLSENSENEASRKRKFSGSSSGSTAGAKSIADSKKIKIDARESNLFHQPNQPKLNVCEQMKKKLVKPTANISKEQKTTKVPYQVLLKRKLHRLGIDSGNMSIPEMKEAITKAGNMSIPEMKEAITKANISRRQSVPPLKIKLTPPTAEGKTNQKTVNSSPRISKPANNSALSRLSVMQNGQKKLHIKSAQPITSLLRPLDSASSSQQKAKVRPTQEGIRQSQRASVRQNDGNYNYRDISLRKFNNFVQIILTPSTTKMKNSFNTRVLRELCDALHTLKLDETVRMVVLTGTGTVFCQGIDLTALQHPNHDTRKKNAENLTKGIKEFLRALVQFPKMIVAGVNGDAMGLGVTMLPLFDGVYASDKAQFYLPYSRLGQVPEGGATYTFPYNYGKLPSCRLFGGHKITAIQAQQMGLVSEALWPNTFLQELIPKVALKASVPTQGQEATKALMNHHLITKLELSVESENRLLLQHWMTASFFTSCKRFLETHDIPFQKPVNLPLY